MAESTKIEWCDATLNLWWGCTKVSDGCKNCYAEKLSDQRYKKGAWGPTGTRLEIKSWMSTLNKISKRAKSENRRLRVFCQSMSDTFEGPETCGGIESRNWQLMEDIRCELFTAIESHPELDFLVLTKRPENVYPLWITPDCGDLPEERWDCGRIKLPPNLWIGTSVEDQATANERIPYLLNIPAKARFLSCEPLLGPVDLQYATFNGADSLHSLEGIHWVICGGESGQEARPMNPDWVRSLRDQCKTAGVPFFFKQWGEWVDEMHLEADCHAQQTSDAFVKLLKDEEGKVCDYEGYYMCRAGKAKAGRLLDGREWNEFPEVN